LAEADYYEAKENLPHIEDELKALLIPKDPNDDKCFSFLYSLYFCTISSIELCSFISFCHSVWFAITKNIENIKKKNKEWMKLKK